MATGGNDIDSLKFSIVLDSGKFEKEMKRVEGLAKSFESSVQKALNTSKLLELAEKGMVKETKQKATAQKEVVLLTRQELEAKKAAGTITDKELRQLKSLIAADKALLDEENKRLSAMKKQLDVENKNLTYKKRKESAERGHGAAVSSTNAKLTSQNVLLKQAAGYLGTYFSLYGGIRLVSTLVRITGEFEAQRAALRAILQDAAGADRIFYQLQELAVKSPYTFKNLTSYAKQLSAFSVPMDEIYETTKKLADVSAGLGVDMSRIILAYGQVRSAAFLRGQEVRQFTESGIPILAELAEQFKEIEGHAVSTGEVFDRISKRQVLFEMVEEAFRRMTSEGGKFYNMQEVLAETVKGKLSNLTDAWQIMLSRVGDQNSGLIKGTLSFVTELIKRYEDLGQVLLSVAAAYGVYKAALMGASALEAAAAVSARFLAVTGKEATKLDVIFHGLSKNVSNGIKNITGLIAKHPWAAFFAAALAAATAVYLQVRKMNEHLRETDRITSKAIASAEDSKSTIHYYVQKLKEAEEGTEEYNKARQAVIDNSGKFISATDAERLSLENVDEVWANICNHIEEATRLQAMQSVTADAAARRQETQLAIMDTIATAKTGRGFSVETQKNIEDLVAGRMTEEAFRKYMEGVVLTGVPAAGFSYARGVNRGAREDLVTDALRWRDDFNKAESVYKETIERAQGNLSALYGSHGPAVPTGDNALKGWRANVEAYLNRVGGGTRGMDVSDATSLADYIKKGAEALNDARDALKHTPVSDADYKAIEKEIAFYEGISEAIYGKGHTEFDNTTTKYKAGAKDAETIRREKIEELKDEVRFLKELKGYYDRLKELGLSDDDIGSIFAPYGRAIPAGGFAKAFEERAVRAEGLGDANLARDIRNMSSGKDLDQDIKALEDRAKALEKYNEAVAKIEASDFNLHGKFFEFDLNKILRDERDTEGQIKKKYNDLIEDAKVAHEGNAEAIAAETKRLEDLRDAEIKYNRQLAQDKVNNLASNYVKNNIMRGKDFTMTDWGDKSMHQVQKIREFFLAALSDIEEKGIEIDDETKKSLEELGLESTDLVELIREIIAGNYRESTLEYFKKLQKSMKQLSSTGSQVGGTLIKLGDTFGNEMVSDLGTALDYMGQLADIVLDCDALFANMAENASEATGETADGVNEVTKAADSLAKSSDWITMIIKVVLLAVEGIANLFNGISEAEKEAERNQRALTLAAYDYLEALHEIERQENETFFGTDQLSMIADSWGNAADAAKNYQDVFQSVIDGFKAGAHHATQFWFWTTRDYQEYRSLWDFIKNKSVQMPDGSWKGLIDENGDLDFAAFKTYWPEWRKHTEDKFGYRLDEATISQGDELLKAIEAYESAIDQFREDVSEIFADLASSIADNMISAFKETGDALANLDAAFDDLGESVVKMMLQSVIARALKPLEDEIVSIWESYSAAAGGENTSEEQKRQATLKAMAGINDIFGEAKDILKDDFWNELLNRAQELGMIGSDESGGDSVGSGIKSITEDTANLLASYINAIRADVSYGRIQWERIAVASEDQAARYITLNDYMAQVAANTFDTAQNTQRILNELQSVIGAEGSSGSIVRVQMS